MMTRISLVLAAASSLLAAPSRAANFADTVIEYSPGTGYATEFGTGMGYTNAAVALGQPSAVTPGPFGGPIDPFNPPYQKEQLVSLGAGGSLTVQFSQPILNDPAHPFGLDFIVFGHAGFVITNANYSGGGLTDGSLFAANSGTTRVSVSADNVHYYQLNPVRTPNVDSLYPTDGSGNFETPVNPGLSNNDFASQGLTGIRALYDGSAGGTGFDLSWAQDANGQRVDLSDIQFVRIDEMGGVADIDALAAVGAVPEPTPWTLLGLGMLATLSLEFTRRQPPIAPRCRQ
jgi:hypothetical protein